MEVIKEPASPSVACSRNLISEHHKCFLQFEAFPISAQPYCLPCTLANHFLLLDALQKKAHTERGNQMVSMHILYPWSTREGAEEKCVKMNL